jgi:hypothetical protein
MLYCFHITTYALIDAAVVGTLCRPVQEEQQDWEDEKALASLKLHCCIFLARTIYMGSIVTVADPFFSFKKRWHFRARRGRR